ncbi:RNA polymerase sigma-70 factor [Sediminibacterium ginsengisoli]|uniref:RNA polymerase sigma-70 factor, ECF subfamily n=1 Tax=Sediminibacterium ginsengisoli TaxID=413434 RepID=A0A1T4NXT7_9BACT|nr:RNA polymerase sigma-70 factor [Sediminibacterium ginsengisoli]SJZ84084.1 RNA polymerase sigma-70 factor, ECF subfamily [Sediminibacterium ginsengisoli]
MFNKSKTYNEFRIVFKQYYPALCFFAEKFVLDKSAAEDIVEDVFIKLWEKEPDFANYKNIKALLYISVKNACFNHLQKIIREKQSLAAYGQFRSADSEDFVLLEMVRSELLRDLYTAMQDLPVECRKVMHLIFVEGWDHKKVASHLEIHVSTVKTQKARGILALRKRLSFPAILWLLYIIFS